MCKPERSGKTETEALGTSPGRDTPTKADCFFEISSVLDASFPGWKEHGECLPEAVQELLTGRQSEIDPLRDGDTGGNVLGSTADDLECDGFICGKGLVLGDGPRPRAFRVNDWRPPGSSGGGGDETEARAGMIETPAEPTCVCPEGCSCGDCEDCHVCGFLMKATGTEEGEIDDEDMDDEWEELLEVLQDELVEKIGEEITDKVIDSLRSKGLTGLAELVGAGAKGYGLFSTVTLGVDLLVMFADAIGSYLSRWAHALVMSERGIADVFVKVCWRVCEEKWCWCPPGFWCTWVEYSTWKKIASPKSNKYGWRTNVSGWSEAPGGK
jgi:hypothetical protein